MRAGEAPTQWGVICLLENARYTESKQTRRKWPRLCCTERGMNCHIQRNGHSRGMAMTRMWTNLKSPQERAAKMARSHSRYESLETNLDGSHRRPRYQPE